MGFLILKGGNFDEADILLYLKFRPESTNVLKFLKLCKVIAHMLLRDEVLRKLKRENFRAFLYSQYNESSTENCLSNIGSKIHIFSINSHLSKFSLSDSICLV